jgi:carboxypeptidase T
VTLTARARDDAYGTVGPPDAPAAQPIAAARYAIDAAPAGANAHKMRAADGTFNRADETVTAVIDTSQLSVGRHTVVIQARDADGNWGPTTAIFLTVAG